MNTPLPSVPRFVATATATRPVAAASARRSRRANALHPWTLALLLLAGGAHAASIEARHAAVAAEHRLASEAGVEILRRGGNAVDAAAAAALATGVVNPSSSGIGGGGFLVLWDARRERATTIDFRETAPRGATRDMFVRRDGATGTATTTAATSATGRATAAATGSSRGSSRGSTVDAEASRTGAYAVGVPGELRGLELALRRHGRLSFADVAAPAIRLARDGFAVEAHLAAQIAAGRARLAADPGLASVFLHEDGSPYREGEILKRPALAATLERLAKVGVDDFYEGQIARDIAATVAGNASVAARTGDTPRDNGARPLDAADLAGFEPVVREPLHVRYRGRDVWSMPPPSSGGGVLGEILDVLSGWQVASVGRTSASAAHMLGETMKAAFADRAVLYGDPAFTRVPMQRLLSPAHAQWIRAKIDWKHVVPSAEFAPAVDGDDDHGTSHISVVDADGNAVALTTSVNTGFGAALSVPSRDIVLNNTMDDFAAAPGRPNAFGLVGSDANAVAPGKRPLSSMTPTVVTDGGRVAFVAGASGGPLIITSTLQALVGWADYGMTPDEAVGAPRVHHQWLPEVLMLEDAWGDPVRTSLERLGHTVKPLSAKASVQAIAVHGRGDDRRLLATSDPRKGGVPAGW